MNNQCTPVCTTASDCEGEDTRPVCGPDGVCVECTEGDTSACPEERPFCETDSHTCVNCADLPASIDADMACEGLDSNTPVCNAGACVQCTELNNAICGGTTPICDIENNMCVACTEHAQCGEAACNFFTGACLPPPDPMFGSPENGNELSAAVNNIDEEGTIILRFENENPYDRAITIDAGRTIAFLADDGDSPIWALTAGGSPQLTVTDATVLISGIEFSSNVSTTDPALLVDGGQAWVDRGRIVLNQGGGIEVENSGTLVLRSSFIGSVIDTTTVGIQASTVDILYSTLGASLGDTAAIQCDGASSVTLRNSLVVSRADTQEVICSSLTASYTAAEMMLEGDTNVSLGDMDTNWFLDYNGGDLHLTGNAPDEIATTAQWQNGDPTIDIDGQPRPSTDGAEDVAGADIP